MHIVVIGAGIIGTATAHALRDEGHRVTLVDPGQQPGRPSDGNAGWIAHTDILPLASPKIWQHVPSWLLDPLGPLTIRLRYAHRIAPWLMRFLLASKPSSVAASTRAIRDLNAQALPAWHRRLEALGLLPHLRESGILSIWNSEAAFVTAQRLIQHQRSLGIPVHVLHPAALRALEPALGPAAVGGALYPTGCHVGDPARLTADLFRLALERGVTFVRGQAQAVTPHEAGAVVRIEGHRIAAERVVVAAGAWSKPLARILGDRVPLDTERGYNITLKPGVLGLSRPVAFEGEGFVTTPLDMGDRVGGAVEFAGLAAPPNHARTDAIMVRLQRYLPDLPSTLEGPRWMGFRPSMPDSLPVIGAATRSPNVIYAFGHAHHGLTQAAVTADLVAALVAGRSPAVNVSPLSARRFRFWTSHHPAGTGHARPVPEDNASDRSVEGT